MDLLLLMACSEGDDGKVEELLDAGADPNVKVRGCVHMCMCGRWKWGGEVAALHWRPMGLQQTGAVLCALPSGQPQWLGCRTVKGVQGRHGAQT